MPGAMERIAVDSKVHFGKPCVAGTRITVQDVLELVDEDIPLGQIICDYYPDLTADDIHACIQHAIATSPTLLFHRASPTTAVPSANTSKGLRIDPGRELP